MGLADGVSSITELQQVGGLRPIHLCESAVLYSSFLGIQEAVADVGDHVACLPRRRESSMVERKRERGTRDPCWPHI